MQQAVAELQARLVPAGFEEFNYHRLAGKGLTVCRRSSRRRRPCL